MTSARWLPVVIASIVAVLVLVAVLGAREEHNGVTADTAIAVPTPATAVVRPTTAIPAPIAEFPAEELYAALTDLCLDSSQQSEDKEWTPEETQAAGEEMRQLMQITSKQLSVSPSTEHLHVAALLERDSTRRFELLDRAIRQSPNDAFLLWRAVQICSEESDTAACDLPDWERKLLSADSQNSESWLRVAANRYKQGETEAALDAMRHAATAAETRIYWTETVEIIERGLAAAGSGHTFFERASWAFSFSAMNIPRYADSTTMCMQQSSLSADWAYTCLGYGELAENQSKTEIGASIGRSIQKMALEALGEPEKAAVVELRRQTRRQEIFNSVGDHQAVTEWLFFSNPTLFYSYLAAIRSHGEIAAGRKIRQQTEQLLEQQPELACEPYWARAKRL